MQENEPMIRSCTPDDFSEILTIINDGARAYQGIIPNDRWNDPYMSSEHLQHEIDSGVVFYGSFDPQDSTTGTLVGVMGIQDVQDVTLIRHAYVRTSSQKQGIGALLLAHLRDLTDRSILIGTWANALWAIRFYERHGFQVVDPVHKTLLLKKYWTVPDRQIETSVVLADTRWRSRLGDKPSPTPV
jgi:GNAT superfamily N-acetyltransferase